MHAGNPARSEQAVNDIIRGIVDVKLDLEHKLEHGLCSSFSSREFELRESVTAATFTQMSLVENYLHQILRRKALKSALDKKPLGLESLQRLTRRSEPPPQQDRQGMRSCARRYGCRQRRA